MGLPRSPSITVLVAQSLFRQGGRTPALSGAARFNPITLPGAETLGNIPLLGPFYRDVLSGNTALVYIALLAVPVTAWVMYQTRYGLRLRAAKTRRRLIRSAFR